MEPEFIRYLASVVPGVIHRLEDRYQVDHSNGDVSTLWLKPVGAIVPPSLKDFHIVFDDFDGADLFSSTFKIASLDFSRVLNGVEITPSLRELNTLVQSESLLSDDGCVPFMTEAGIWIYLFDPSSLSIRKWSLEDHEECESYPSLQVIIEEWVRIVLKS